MKTTPWGESIEGGEMWIRVCASPSLKGGVVCGGVSREAEGAGGMGSKPTGEGCSSLNLSSGLATVGRQLLLPLEEGRSPSARDRVLALVNVGGFSFHITQESPAGN